MNHHKIILHSLRSSVVRAPQDL